MRKNFRNILQSIVQFYELNKISLNFYSRSRIRLIIPTAPLLSENAYPLVFAHRGFIENTSLKDNSLSAFEYAVKHNADGYECDVRLSKDEEIVICHDMWIYRNRHIKWVHRENYKSLVKTLGSCDNLPLLSDLLDIIPPSKILFIEIKSLDRVDIMMKKIYKLIGNRSNVWLRIYWKKLLLATKAYSSFNIASALISANSFRLKDAQKYRVKMFSPFYLITPIGLVRRRQQQGFYMVPWTVNRSYFMNKYFQASVDGILTDKLVKAQQIRNKYQNKYY